jgi:hypothetical protein
MRSSCGKLSQGLPLHLLALVEDLAEAMDVVDQIRVVTLRKQG